MHELAVTESILEITLRHARESNARRVTDLYLVVGSLSSIVDDSVQFYWDFVAKESLAAGAKLHFRRIPAEFLCLDCTRKFSPSGEDFLCPGCGSPRLKITAGEEFFLESIAIET